MVLIGGHYVNIGCSQLISDGKVRLHNLLPSISSFETATPQVKLKRGLAPVEYTGNGLKMDDGSEIAADVIVFATGCGSVGCLVVLFANKSVTLQVS